MVFSVFTLLGICWLLTVMLCYFQQTEFLLLFLELFCCILFLGLGLHIHSMAWDSPIGDRCSVQFLFQVFRLWTVIELVGLFWSTSCSLVHLLCAWMGGLGNNRPSEGVAAKVNKPFVNHYGTLLWFSVSSKRLKEKLDITVATRNNVQWKCEKRYM